MRFDDMLATVLAQPDGRGAARLAKWRQLVDLIAQPGRGGPSDLLDQALAYLRQHRDAVPLGTRRDIARSLAGRRVSPLLLRLFGEDLPAIAAPVIGTARLAPEEWLALLPAMTPTARALLRHRRDLAPEVAKALAAFGASDFVLPGAPGEAPATAEAAISSPAGESGEAQIRELVARIEAFQRHRKVHAPSPAPEVEALPPIEGFRWETGPDGIILWVEGAPRGPLIGQSIATIAGTGAFGVDGQAAGAFEKKAPFRDARFRVVGSGDVAGDWRISGVPCFDPERGSFIGYRGSARRPRVDEVARADLAEPTGLFGTGVPADALRQLIHELRTPLNAIAGFAEMIDGQYMGPAAAGYRTRAKEIMEQAARLLSAVDDLDTAARIETHRLVLGEGATDTAELLQRLDLAYAPVAAQRGAALAARIAPDLPPGRVEAATGERMIARLLAATIGLAGPGETIAAALASAEVGGKAMLCLAIDRPHAIAGRVEAALLDPGYSPEGDWPGAPALGLGFALRLVRNLAEAAGGALVIGEDRFYLYLPAVEPAERSSERGS